MYGIKKGTIIMESIYKMSKEDNIFLQKEN